jgi:hypothetical protein
VEQIINYEKDKWWYFVTFLELGATISANPELSAKRTDFHPDYIEVEDTDWQIQGESHLDGIYD